MSSNLVSEPVASAMSVCTLCDLAKRTRRFSVVLVLALRLSGSRGESHPGYPTGTRAIWLKLIA